MCVLCVSESVCAVCVSLSLSKDRAIKNNTALKTVFCGFAKLCIGIYYYNYTINLLLQYFTTQNRLLFFENRSKHQQFFNSSL